MTKVCGDCVRFVRLSNGIGVCLMYPQDNYHHFMLGKLDALDRLTGACPRFVERGEGDEVGND